MEKHAFDPACCLGERLQTLSRAELTALAETICRILTERGTYHGGIRPDNISRAGDGTVGLGAPARTNTKDWTTEELEFMAPEVFWSGALDASADVYSLGLLLYAGVMGGRLPFYPDDRAPLPEDQTDALRRRIRDPRLKSVKTELGRKSHTQIEVMYLDGVVDPELPKEVMRRLNMIDIDSVLATGIIEESLMDCPRSPLPQLIHTERPDRFAMYMADGRVGILIDGIPIALVVPASFAEFMKVTSDSSMHFAFSSMLSVMRYLALIVSVYVPAIYVAVAMYHQEMIPTRLLLSIISAEQDVPFSTWLEVIGMLVALELLQEAGLRLPNPIGDTVSIIGALIVGQSAVEAKVASPIAIIVVAVSAIACYTLPSQDLGAAVRLIRFALLIGAVAAGLFGIGLLSCLMLLSMADMDSFGRNYTSPVTDGRPHGLMRTLLRIPKTADKFRDAELRPRDRRRQS